MRDGRHRTGIIRFSTAVLAGLLIVITTGQTPKVEPTLAEFESGLQQYPTGYVLYVKLDNKQKQAVYAEFLKTDAAGRYAAAIKKAIALSVQ